MLEEALREISRGSAEIIDNERIEKLLRIITDFLIEWHDIQQKTFPTIDGIFMLDDIIGFIGKEEFKHFGLPYFKELFDRDVSVKFLHNDADCMVSINYLNDMGINLFNMGFDTSLNVLKSRTSNKITMLGNIPPRDVMANGKAKDVRKAVKDLLSELDDKKRIIVSCGGGMTPYTPTANIKAFIDAVKEFSW